MATVLNRSTDWETVEQAEAGVSTSPSAVGIGGVLEQMPPALFPEIPTVRDLRTVQIEPPYPIFLPTHVDHDGATVSAASYRVTQLGGVLSEAEVVAFLREAGAPSAWIPDLVAISWCESKHSPGAVGDSGNSLGQYQLWNGWFRAGEDPFDPLTNARVAVRVRETRGRFGGAGGWSCAGLNGIS